jgi:hypothetical protein
MRWLSAYKDKGFGKIYIYDKSDPQKDIHCPSLENTSTKCEVKRIPNVGVCDQTYLYHIVHEYNNLADVTIFAPGSADMDIKIKITDFIMNKVFETKNTVFVAYDFGMGVGDAMYYFTLPNYLTGYKANQNSGLGDGEQTLAEIRPFGAWYEKHFPGEQTKKSTFFGVMAISREHIHKKPKSFYESLLKEVSTDKFHEASHFIERAWTGMVHPIPDDCFYRLDVMDDAIGIGVGGFKFLQRK